MTASRGRYAAGDTLVTGADADVFGYLSELERTIFIGAPTAEQRRMPGLGGFRHSDTVLITEDGLEMLTYYPRDLDSLVLPPD